MKPLAPRERRLVALGILVAVIAVIWLALVGPIIDGFSDRAAERARLTASFRRNERLIADAPIWRAAARSQQAVANRFSLPASSEGLAADALKAKVQQLAAGEGYTVAGFQDITADAAPGRVRIRADAQMTLTQLCDSLRRLEAEGVYVLVNVLSISADRALKSGRAAPLDVRLELSADYRPPAGRTS
ncbi:MAG TPA: type II secretion system protein GspM [Caulobacteraceae bacterium]|nr:type II secretion system protein GspM [Caulobacteraceae bacterium]